MKGKWLLKRLGWALFWGLVAYGVGALLGLLLVAAFSANTHDKEMEVLMTGFFFTGPIGAVVGAVLSLVWPRRPKGEAQPPHP